MLIRNEGQALGGTLNRRPRKVTTNSNMMAWTVNKTEQTVSTSSNIKKMVKINNTKTVVMDSKTENSSELSSRSQFYFY